MKLPKLKIKLNSSTNKDFYLTDSDDIGFARKQLNSIDNRIQAKREFNLKPWERSINNNIYATLDDKNKLLIREKRQKIKKNNWSFNWNNQNYYTRTEVNNIKLGEEIKRQTKIKYEIKYKYMEPNLTLSNFVHTRNETFLTNQMINILKERQINFTKIQEKYEKSLKHENKSLDKDIDTFTEYTLKLKKKNQENEILLSKVITDNKNLVDLYRKQLQDYNGTIYELFKYIRGITSLKHYANFIHKILGGDNDILHCELYEDLNFNEFKNSDISSITHNIIKRTKNLINNNSTQINEIFDLKDMNTINIFDLSFKELEDKIVKTFIEKQQHISDKEEIINSGQKNEEDKKKQFEHLNKDYDSQLQELGERLKDYKKIFLSPEEEKNLGFFYESLKEIYHELFGSSSKSMKEINHIKNAYDMNKEVAIPIIREVHKKEKMVNKMIKIMEECESENSKMFNKILNRKKMENRAMKLIKEKEMIIAMDNLRRKKYNNKMKKFIIKGRYKMYYPAKPDGSKKKLSKANKSEMDINDLNYIYFQ